MFNSWKLIGFQESDEFFNHLKNKKSLLGKQYLESTLVFRAPLNSDTGKVQKQITCLIFFRCFLRWAYI